MTLKELSNYIEALLYKHEEYADYTVQINDTVSGFYEVEAVIPNHFDNIPFLQVL